MIQKIDRVKYCVITCWSRVAALPCICGGVTVRYHIESLRRTVIAGPIKQ